LCNLYSVTKGQHAIRELAGAMRDRDFTLRTLVTPGSDFFPLRTNTGDGMPQRAYLDGHREPERHRVNDTDRRRHQGEDPTRNESDDLGRSQLQQVPGEACLRSPQARWPLCHHPENGTGIRREFAGCQIPWRWTGNNRENESARDRDRP
jgi:hypothetical protein